ncbi:MAG TPA: sigma 54-interacting transcriptional regulator, partial [Syntrophomonas sp.]|nr:sigma 54-interacting transcriptional regulator [Syntrophomonas sp.]
MNYDYCKADSKELFEAWNMFADTGIFPQEYLRREDSYTSWVRCEHRDIYRKELSSRIAFCDKDVDDCLIVNSYRVMDCMNHMLTGMLRPNYALLLTDAAGKPLVDISYRDNDVIPWEKGNYVEHHTVLKALDIACNEKQVIEVYGYEHLYQRGNNWHTIGYPIFNYDKTVAGGLGVICQTDRIQSVVPIVKIGSHLLQSSVVLAQIAKNSMDALVEGNRDAAVIINENGVILNGNSFFMDLVNSSAEQVIGRDFIHFLHGRVDEYALYSYYDGVNGFDDLCLMNQLNEKKIPVRMKKSIIGCYESHPLWLLSFQTKKSLRDRVQGISYEDQSGSFENLIGDSSAIVSVKKMGQKAARSASTVLIEGESGTGKELAAQSIHQASRPQGPFVAINCGAITRELLQSELFGYEEGAFTGAKKGGQPGKFEVANGGTVFLDEIGEMPLDMQVSLLRCLQEKTVVRVGGTQPRKIDVRIIAATNRCLSDEVQKGTFREDLYYRLNVIKIRMPALREHIQDIPALSRHILDSLSQTLNVPGPVQISKEAMDCLCHYDWPGNVRELQNCLEGALVYMEDNIIDLDCLPLQIASSLPQTLDSGSGKMQEYERFAIIESIMKNHGNLSQSARE